MKKILQDKAIASTLTIYFIKKNCLLKYSRHFFGCKIKNVWSIQKQLDIVYILYYYHHINNQKLALKTNMRLRSANYHRLRKISAEQLKEQSKKIFSTITGRQIISNLFNITAKE